MNRTITHLIKLKKRVKKVERNFFLPLPSPTLLQEGLARYKIIGRHESEAQLNILLQKTLQPRARAQCPLPPPPPPPRCQIRNTASASAPIPCPDKAGQRRPAAPRSAHATHRALWPQDELMTHRDGFPTQLRLREKLTA
jgi:hypothetical protein